MMKKKILLITIIISTIFVFISSCGGDNAGPIGLAGTNSFSFYVQVKTNNFSIICELADEIPIILFNNNNIAPEMTMNGRFLWSVDFTPEYGVSYPYRIYYDHMRKDTSFIINKITNVQLRQSDNSNALLATFEESLTYLSNNDIYEFDMGATTNISNINNISNAIIIKKDILSGNLAFVLSLIASNHSGFSYSLTSDHPSFTEKKYYMDSSTITLNNLSLPEINLITNNYTINGGTTFTVFTNSYYIKMKINSGIDLFNSESVISTFNWTAYQKIDGPIFTIIFKVVP